MRRDRGGSDRRRAPLRAGTGRARALLNLAMNPCGVLIVGDGPAGCAAAIAAASAGGDVTMLGRGRSCAAPECASGMTLKLLDRLAPRVAAQPATWLDAEADA